MEIVCVLNADPPGLLGDLDRQGPPEDLWEGVLRRLEGIGAALESERQGEAFFAGDGLRGIHGGGIEGVVAAARKAAGRGAAIGVAPTRFAAFATASREPVRGDPGGVRTVSESELPGFLGSLPISTLRERLEIPERDADTLLEALRRLGIGTLKALAALPPDRVADRFGRPGLRALRLARGEDEPLRPRAPREELVEEIELPEGTVGPRLDRALELLVDRLLAAPQRRGRTVLGVRLAARLSGGGGWSLDQGLGRPTASARTMLSALVPRLESLPAPAVSLRLRALGLGPPAGDQLALSAHLLEQRRRRLGAAVREVREAQGPESLLKVLPLDEGSRLPELRAILTPFPERDQE